MKRPLWWVFAAVCVLSGSGWLADEWRAPMLPGLAGGAVHLGVLCAVFWGLGVRAKDGRGSLQIWLPVGLWGAVLFGAPQVASAAAGGSLPRLTQVLVYTLVPVLVLMVVTQRGAEFGAREGPLRLLPAALAGMAGVALLLPFALPGSAAGWGWLAVTLCCAAGSALAAVRLKDLVGSLNPWRAAAVICGATALLTGACCRVGWTGWVGGDRVSAAVEVARCLLLDGPVMFLIVWLLQVMEPVALSARYLLIPLVTIVEGMLIVRPEVTWTMIVGLALLAGGSVGLLQVGRVRTERLDGSAEGR